MNFQTTTKFLNRYKILGRASVDIIKSGGFKISALDIERELLERADVAEAAVMGVEDETWGEVVAAVIRLKQQQQQQPMTAEAEAEWVAEMQAWARESLAAYKVPRKVVLVEEIPKNAMGKPVYAVLCSQDM